ncbi:conserved hypothetical protein [Thermosediminibacter oceani DSM 16646]|uniref:Uncharacterized protein n=1 Tax=Thermosediminibacter oceani (strain ATCC BAA-1034 / DSM 16646 / JW/IW-1228P) TaxID=555079 RepID=D9S1Y8_THEOJ|nr:conserved hypothetical protein [Thermosediminibacter oceani DSM 16646]
MRFIFNKFVLFSSIIFVILFTVNLYEPTALDFIGAIVGGIISGIIIGTILYVIRKILT